MNGLNASSQQMKVQSTLLLLIASTDGHFVELVLGSAVSFGEEHGELRTP